MPRMRVRTEIRAGRAGTELGDRPGQPGLIPTDPQRIPHRKTTKHTCGWCGGPRNHSQPFRHRVLCHSCMRAEFGSPNGYDHFIRSERQRTKAAERRRRQAGNVGQILREEWPA